MYVLVLYWANVSFGNDVYLLERLNLFLFEPNFAILSDTEKVTLLRIFVCLPIIDAWKIPNKENILNTLLEGPSLQT